MEKIGNVPRTLANQLLRSATSIGANVEEGRAKQISQLKCIFRVRKRESLIIG